jgi:hypothetical protein
MLSKGSALNQITISEAHYRLHMNFKDILRLLVFYSRQTGASSAKVKDVIGRSAIVLITAYWEAFCEDLVDEALTHLAIHAPGPEDLGVELRKDYGQGDKAGGQ